MNAATNNREIATTILAQLGGNRFVAMTGARDILTVQGGLVFKLGRGAKMGINSVHVQLEADDTYTLKFYAKGRARKGSIEPYTCVAAIDQVYADSLRTVFTEQTGLYTSL